MIQVSGKPYDTYPFLEDGLSPRDALEDEGIEFDDSGVADEQRKVTVEDLRERLDEMGLMPKVPRRAWLVRGSSVNGKDLVPTWLNEGWISLPATNLRRVDAGVTRDELKPIIDEDYAHASNAEKANKLDELHAFLSRMQPDHLVATVSQSRLHVGRIVGSATFEDVPNGDSNVRRAVEWAGGPEGIDYSDFPGDLAARLKVQRDVLDLTQQIEILEGLSDLGAGGRATSHCREGRPAGCVTRARREASRPPDVAAGVHRPVKRSAAADLRRTAWDGEDLHRSGPRQARRRGQCALVQFHPSYAYEDFFEGFRPTPEGGFRLKPGPIRRIVEQAVANPTVPHVLIIDEITAATWPRFRRALLPPRVPKQQR